ncbi:hypothetical protein QBK99_09065 [Corticibacterium sp. UT-5YL-CI-8]|nr:hypothetical protein [Tianweitania sp. UT-5YL-CI-8]
MLSRTEIDTIVSYRHHVRSNGCWGGCFEVSCFIEHKFGWRRRDGVFQLENGTPVFLHSWNHDADGAIVDGTADQFLLGEDVAFTPYGERGQNSYREKYTRAHNPSQTPWLCSNPYVGVPDQEFWNARYEARELGPGWWLADNGAYLDWMRTGAKHYWLFATKLNEYQAAGYPV